MHQRDVRAAALHGWTTAVAVTLSAAAAMLATAALGLWLAGAGSLPGGSFWPVTAACVLLAVGVPVRLTTGAGELSAGQADISALPLSVSLAGALTVGWLFLRALRLRAVIGPGELTGRVARVALVWTVALVLLAAAARHSFPVATGNPLVDSVGGEFGVTPSVGLRADPGPAVGFGLLWLAVVLAVSFAVSTRAPLPRRLARHHRAIRPAAHAVLSALGLYVVLAFVAAVVVAAVHGPARDTFAMALLGLPNLAWLAFGLGLGASWHGRVAGSIGLPVPKPLAQVLHGQREVTLDLGTLAQQDGRAWLLLPLAGLVLLLAGVGAALHSPMGVRPWRHALHLAVAVALAVLLAGLGTRISALYGLGLLGLDATGSVVLTPRLLVAVPLGAAWGAVTGLLGAMLVRLVRHR